MSRKLQFICTLHQVFCGCDNNLQHFCYEVQGTPEVLCSKFQHFCHEMQKGTPDERQERNPDEPIDEEAEPPTQAEWKEAEKNAEDVVDQKLAALFVTTQRYKMLHRLCPKSESFQCQCMALFNALHASATT